MSLEESSPAGDGDSKKLGSVLGTGRGCLPKHELSFLAEGLAKGGAWPDAPAPLPGDGGPRSCDREQQS